MRMLNSQVEKSSWPIPTISERLDKLFGCHWFSSIDLADGFHQIGYLKIVRSTLCLSQRMSV